MAGSEDAQKWWRRLTAVRVAALACGAIFAFGTGVSGAASGTSAGASRSGATSWSALPAAIEPGGGCSDPFPGECEENAVSHCPVDGPLQAGPGEHCVPIEATIFQVVAHPGGGCNAEDIIQVAIPKGGAPFESVWYSEVGLGTRWWESPGEPSPIAFGATSYTIPEGFAAWSAAGGSSGSPTGCEGLPGGTFGARGWELVTPAVEKLEHETEAKEKAEREARERAEGEAKAKSEAEARARAEAESRSKQLASSGEEAANQFRLELEEQEKALREACEKAKSEAEKSVTHNGVAIQIITPGELEGAIAFDGSGGSGSSISVPRTVPMPGRIASAPPFGCSVGFDGGTGQGSAISLPLTAPMPGAIAAAKHRTQAPVLYSKGHARYTTRGNYKLQLTFTKAGKAIAKQIKGAELAYRRKHPHGRKPPLYRFRLTLRFIPAG